MKIACDKCLTVKDSYLATDWLHVQTGSSEYILCPNCAKGFCMAVDNRLPPVIAESGVIVTNADKIRSMTNEQLMWVVDCPDYNCHEDENQGPHWCEKCKRDWLRDSDLKLT